MCSCSRIRAASVSSVSSSRTGTAFCRMIGPLFPEGFHNLSLEGLSILPERPMVDDGGRNARLLCALDHGCPRDVADEHDEVRREIAAIPRVDEALEVRAASRGQDPDAEAAHRIPQCLKSRVPVKTIAMPCPFAASMTSGSRMDPPGWATTAMPPFANSSIPSRNGK